MTQLPADEHRAEILDRIRRFRVTIIQGETGCGKSSRVPLMLMQATPGAKMMCAQPRRIAVKGLHQRYEQEGHGELVGMRMGGGIRVEGRRTRMWLVTTGYLVRLASGNPGAFRDHTHLIIDECHERTLDSDVLCMMARRLLQQHSHLHLVLMSATVHTSLFAEYFREAVGGSVGQPLFVGARCFPLTTYYLADMERMDAGKLRASASKLQKMLEAEGNAQRGQQERGCKPQARPSIYSPPLWLSA